MWFPPAEHDDHQPRYFQLASVGFGAGGRAGRSEDVGEGGIERGEQRGQPVGRQFSRVGWRTGREAGLRRRLDLGGFRCVFLVLIPFSFLFFFISSLVVIRRPLLCPFLFFFFDNYLLYTFSLCVASSLSPFPPFFYLLHVSLPLSLPLFFFFLFSCVLLE